MSEPMNPPPGWYPDPAGPGARYWDGGRWTDDTQAAAPVGQGPVPAGPGAGAPLPPPTPSGQPTGTGQPVRSATASPTLSGFLDQLKRLDPVALAVAGFVVFVIATFLPWISSSLSGPGGEVSDSSNAWSNEAPWRFRGFGVEEAIESATSGGTVTGGTDLILILPLAIASLVLLIVAGRNAKARYVTEAAALAAVLLVLVLILEIVHIGSWYDDGQQALDDLGITASLSGSPAIGLWLALLAAAVIAFAAVRAVLTARRPT